MKRAAAFVVVIVALAAINGGYVYRTTCKRANGGSATYWTYGFSGVVPYRHAAPPSPCTAHSGTRVALDAIGIDEIDDSAPVAAPRDPAGAAAIGRALGALARAPARALAFARTATTSADPDVRTTARVLVALVRHANAPTLEQRLRDEVALLHSKYPGVRTWPKSPHK